MTGSSRAFECAFVLLAEHADCLTIQQHIACEIALMAGPERAPLSIIPLAVQIIGVRQ